MMMPPPDPRDGYGDGYNYSNNSYRRSPVDPRVGSIQQHPEGHSDSYGPPHTRLSPRIDYLAPSGPPRHPSYYPNPYSTGMGHPHRSQSPQSVGYGVQRSDSANQIPSSTSPRMFLQASQHQLGAMSVHHSYPLIRLAQAIQAFRYQPEVTRGYCDHLRQPTTVPQSQFESTIHLQTNFPPCLRWQVQKSQNLPEPPRVFLNHPPWL